MDNEQLTPPGIMPVPNFPPNSVSVITPTPYPSHPCENTRSPFQVYQPNPAFSSNSQNFNPHFCPPMSFQFAPGRLPAPYAPHVSEQMPNTILHPNMPNYPSNGQVPVAVSPYGSAYDTIATQRLDGNGFQFSQQIVQDGSAPQLSLSTSNYQTLVQSNESWNSGTMGRGTDGNLYRQENSGELNAVQSVQRGCSESSVTCQIESLDRAHYSTNTMDQSEEVGLENKKRKMQQTPTEQKSSSETCADENDHSKSGSLSSFIRSLTIIILLRKKHSLLQVLVVFLLAKQDSMVKMLLILKLLLKMLCCVNRYVFIYMSVWHPSVFPSVLIYCS